MASWSEAQSHKTGKRQPREVTHELVVLHNPEEASHKNSASSVEGNYTQLKNSRGPTGNYQQLVYKQDGSKCNDDEKKETIHKVPKSGKEYEMKTERSQCKQMEQQPYNRDHRKENKTVAKTSPKKSCAIRIIAAMSVLSVLLATVALVGVLVILVQEYPGGGDQSKQALEAAMLNLQGQNALEEKLLALLKEQNTTSAKIDMFLATLNNIEVTAVNRSEFDQLSTTVDSNNSSAQESFSELTDRLNNLSSTVNNLYVKPFQNCHTQIFTSSQTLQNSDTVFTTLFNTSSYYVNRTDHYTVDVHCEGSSNSRSEQPLIATLRRSSIGAAYCACSLRPNIATNGSTNTTEGHFPLVYGSETARTVNCTLVISRCPLQQTVG